MRLRSKRKLIEVALPLDDINAAAAAEKNIRQGHPSGLHMWWARRPLAVTRAVVFSQLVDDPSGIPEEFPSTAMQEAERERLFTIVRDLVKWENSADENVLHRARREIARSLSRDSEAARAVFHDRLSPDEVLDFLTTFGPKVMDPFAGGGSIPLEAHRLGLRACASDLNPVPVLINKALVEFPPEFAGLPPVNPKDSRRKTLEGEWPHARGLAADVAYYAERIHAEAAKRLAHLYPTLQTPQGPATVVAWLFARTVTCPNPACRAVAPLLSTSVIFRKAGQNKHLAISYEGLEPRFEIREGLPTEEEDGTRAGKKATFVCARCRYTLESAYLRAEGMANRIGMRMTAVVAEGKGRRIFASPPADHVAAVNVRAPPGLEEELPDDPRNIWCKNYGLNRIRDLFTPRQFMAMTTFSDLVVEARAEVIRDAATITDRDTTRYADAVAVYLSFIVSKMADLNNSVCRWKVDRACPVNLFARQTIPMVWDFPETNPLSNSSGSWYSLQRNLMAAMDDSSLPATGPIAEVRQADARRLAWAGPVVLSTDPPYYDNISYADLSDFFYAWLRRSLASTKSFPFLDLISTPKEDELISAPYRHGGREEGDRRFESGLFATFRESIANAAGFPAAIYYAFKQTETDRDGFTSTGWITFLTGVINAGYSVVGAWPVKSEMEARQIAAGTNALASSIVLVCRPRALEAGVTTRQALMRELKAEMPHAIKAMVAANLQPVDLAQAAIGPGMRVFSKYSRVLEPSGESMSVATALQLVNAAIDEARAEHEAEYDRETRWAVDWFGQYRHGDGPYGAAETLATFRGTSIDGLEKAGIVKARGGKVRLLDRTELPTGYDPARDDRPTVWEATHYLIRALESGGEEVAASLHAKLGARAGEAKELAYWLFQTCERNNWSKEGQGYNALVASWHEIQRLSQSGPKTLEDY